MLIQELRRYGHVVDFGKKRLFDPFSGLSTPSAPAHKSAPRAEGPPVSGTRETWLAPHVPLATVLPPHAPRRHQRGQVVRDPPHWLLPDTDRQLSKIERGPITTNGPSILSISPNRAIPAEKSIRCSLLAVGPLTILSWPELNASRSRRACRMAHTAQCPFSACSLRFPAIRPSS